MRLASSLLQSNLSFQRARSILEQLLDMLVACMREEYSIPYVYYEFIFKSYVCTRYRPFILCFRHMQLIYTKNTAQCPMPNGRARVQGPPTLSTYSPRRERRRISFVRYPCKTFHRNWCRARSHRIIQTSFSFLSPWISPHLRRPKHYAPGSSCQNSCSCL